MGEGTNYSLTSRDHHDSVIASTFTERKRSVANKEPTTTDRLPARKRPQGKCEITIDDKIYVFRHPVDAQAWIARWEMKTKRDFEGRIRMHDASKSEPAIRRPRR